MTEYTLKFMDLQEGKTYETKNACSKYIIIQGLLWSFETKDWSEFTHNEVSQMRFKEVIQISDEEKQFLSFIDDKFEWIAKDKDGEVYVFATKPFKTCVTWDRNDYHTIYEIELDLFNLNFDFLSWEDEEPIRISDLLD